MPAEWEPQSATWLSWPSNPALWPGHYDLIPAKFAEFAAAISRFQPVKINAAGKLRAEAERELKAAKADLSVIELTDIATDDEYRSSSDDDDSEDDEDDDEVDEDGNLKDFIDDASEESESDDA